MTEITPEQARQVLADEQRRKLEACQRELEALLNKYGFALGVNLRIVEGRITGDVVLTEAVNAT
jgi:hypothetical protein